MVSDEVEAYEVSNYVYLFALLVSLSTPGREAPANSSITVASS